MIAQGATAQEPQTSGDTNAVAVRAPADHAVSYPYSFAVLGHIRGGRDGAVNYLLADVIHEVKSLRPDFVVLTGDIIWGEIDAVPTDPARVHAQWNAVDSALAALGVPIYRVPGNHDISDRLTRGIYEERYGAVHKAIDLGDARLILYTSGFLPDSNDTRKHAHIRGLQPDSARIDWLRDHLGGAADAPAFFFMHHLLWWEEADSPWWRLVHPLLAASGVRVVFSGDYGPLKFSHMEKDGIDYYQSGITPNPAVLELLRGHEWNRILAGQFDSFLFVDVPDRDSVNITLHTVGETKSGDFTPALFRKVHGGINRPAPPGGRARLQALWENQRGRSLLIGLPLAGLVGGIVIGAGLMRLRRG